MWRNFVIVGLGALVVGVPFLLRQPEAVVENPDATLVIVTPHFESIRAEFARGFREWYFAKTGKTVAIDWRVIGGTSETLRYIRGEYANAFRLHWTRDLKREWNNDVARGFANRRLSLPANPADDTPAQAARRAFLASEVGINIDLFFGGGSFDYAQLASEGLFQPAGLLSPERVWGAEAVAAGTALPLPQGVLPVTETDGWFGDEALDIPRTWSGEPFYDFVGLQPLAGQPRGDLWHGAVTSSFGLIYNVPSLRRLGFTIPTDGRSPLRTWRDLADDRLLGQVALADPTKSGSINKAFELIVQTEMNHVWQEALRDPSLDPELRADLLAYDAALRARPDAPIPSDRVRAFIARGWDAGMRLITLIASNARYFTDASTKPSVDVSSGDCAAGMSIDFYGRTQEEILENRAAGTAAHRFRFVMPEGGSPANVDPIALFRGAPKSEIAAAFIEYVLSLEGQAVWNFRAGERVKLGEQVLLGPREVALRRPPVRREMYREPLNSARSDAAVDPYDAAKDFTYRAAWTGPLFNSLRFIIRNAMIDVSMELKAARRAILRAKAEGRADDAAAAEAILLDIAGLDYTAANGAVREATSSGAKPMQAIAAARDLALKSQQRYQRALAVAEGRR